MDLTFWGLHAGKSGDADFLFLKKNFIAIGWDRMGDLGKLSADRQAFKSALQQAYPEDKPGAIALNTGQVFRFIHEMKVSDIVLYPSKIDRHIHFGRVEGGYHYNPTIMAEYPNLRVVKWKNLSHAHNLLKVHYMKSAQL